MISSLLAAHKRLSVNERLVFLVAATIFILAFITSLGYWYFSVSSIIPAQGGEYTEGLVGQPSFINPVLSNANEIDHALMVLMFADLETLAESIEHSEDGKEWTLVLRDNLVWSDGETLDINDVLFTIDTIKNREANSPLFSTWRDVDVKIVDERTLTFKLPAIYSYFGDTLADFRPIPQHAFGSIPPSNLRISEFSLEPIASGPYRFLSIEKERDGLIAEYKLVRNNNYAGERALIGRFNVRFFQTFKEALAAFNRHYLDGIGGLRNEHVASISRQAEVYTFNVPRYYALFVNQSANAALAELEVRKAMDLAIDRKSLINSALEGQGEIADGPILPFLDGYLKPEDNKQSLREAKKVLGDAGWETNKDTGLREKDGEVLDFDLIVPNIDFLVESAQILQKQVKEIGVNFSPIVLEPEDVNEEIIKTRNYQILLFGNVLRENSDIYSFWHSNQRFYPGLNLSLYSNPEVDEALGVSRTVFDQEERAAALNLIQSKIRSGLPAIFLYSPNYIYASRPETKGIEGTLLPSPADHLEEAAAWYFETTRSFKS
ncbi:MAG: hypothetical protein COU09_01335 [Candidatus Harrisonbacteria bacterium CG10_big_fil_rev_8_21_14_0_10_44_23]|uniref:Solute-binding protein family 5 domain-containing protein n=1 Tax=Candidatus Harrisonbacteria bacterium CG10_big_fil_rev_8_21_14_0_10_44_23 TaxID=1974585 RepID=A0A2H0UQF3_9BACT|nr:MAG: hypothetical protein COU09_01335 [Candidatus Harrisonbacteria bacterium CG10_big_fil_rev_8_21_14_0_10_44_23]